MDGEGEVDRLGCGAASFASLLFGEEKRRTCSMQSVFEAPAVASALPSKMGVRECRFCSVTDVFDRPLSYCCDVSPSCAPPSVMGDVGNDGGKKKEEERREDRTEEEEESKKQLSISSNVDDGNEEEEGGGEEKEEQEEEEEEKEKEEQEEEEDEKEEVVEQEEAIHGSHIRRYQRRLSIREVRHFPPPIPLLAQTGNLQCHMPWVLKRSYKKDGRLVLREVKVKHHEFFRAHRSNGRLTLQVVHFEDSSREHLDQHRHEEEEEEEEEKEEEEEGEEGEEGTEADPPPSPASPRSSSSTISPPPPASSTSTSDQDEKGLHEINAPAPASLSPSTPSSSSPFFSSDSPSTLSSSSSCNDENDNEGNDVESSIKPDRTATLCIEENMNAPIGIVGGCFANSLVQMPIPTIRPVIVSGKKIGDRFYVCLSS